MQCRPCTRRRALLAWPGLASRLHLHVLTARSALATSPAGRASNWRLRHFGTSRRCDDDSTAPRHFVTGRFSRPFLGNWEPRLFSFASPPLRTSLMNMTTTAMNFTCLLIYYFYYPFTSSWPPFRNLLPDTQHRFTHACTADFFFFFFFYWAARRIPLGGAEPQATNGLAQKRCVRPVHLRDRGLCLSLGFSRKKKKHWHAEQRATQKKATPWEEVGSSMGAVERLASLGFIALWFFLGTASWPLFFLASPLVFLWGLLAQPLTSLLLSSHFLSLPALALSVGRCIYDGTG